MLYPFLKIRGLKLGNKPEYGLKPRIITLMVEKSYVTE